MVTAEQRTPADTLFASPVENVTLCGTNPNDRREAEQASYQVRGDLPGYQGSGTMISALARIGPFVDLAFSVVETLLVTALRQVAFRSFGPVRGTTPGSP